MPEQQIRPEDRYVIYTIPGMEQAKVQKDLIYKTVEGMDLKLDVYYPAHHDGHTPLPAVILVHGDAPQERLRNAKDWGQYIGWGQLIAACGFIAIPFNHRSLERLTKTEEVMSDVEDAISYVQKNSQALHIDTHRLCIWTYSAGGPFGLRAALSTRSSFVRCLVCYYSMADLRFLCEHLEGTNPRLNAEPFSPYSAVDHIRNHQGDVPPLFVARAGLDYAALEKNAALTLMNHPTGHHGFDVLDKNQRSQEIIRATLEFLQTYLAK